MPSHKLISGSEISRISFIHARQVKCPSHFTAISKRPSSSTAKCCLHVSSDNLNLQQYRSNKIPTLYHNTKVICSMAMSLQSSFSSYNCNSYLNTQESHGVNSGSSFKLHAVTTSNPATTSRLAIVESPPQTKVQSQVKKLGRFAVFQTGHASPYATVRYGGYGQMFIDLLGEEHEEWEVYSMIDGHFPTAEELRQLDGCVITGSRHDAHGDEPWIEPLCDILRSFHKEKKKMLGICFGHQVLSRALGGKTGRSGVGYTLGLKEIPLTPALASKPYAKGLPPVIRILGVHQDQVSQVPPGGELLASTDRTKVEMFAVGNHVLAIQGHPEFTKDVVADLIDKRLVNGIITAEHGKEAHASMEKAEIDREALQRMCKSFLKGNYAN